MRLNWGRTDVLLSIASFAAGFGSISYSQAPPNIGKPDVQEISAPKVFEQQLTISELKPYVEGQEVKVIGDLKEEGEAPSGGEADVQGPTAPNVTSQNTSKLPAIESYKPGDLIKVVPDLKASAGAGSAAASTPAAVPAAIPFHLRESFDGIPATAFLPPDVAGAVGREHYVLMVNVAFAIYDKHGTRLAGPTPINTLWSGFGGPCTTLNNGDPIVRFDKLADRWLMSQFALPGGAAGFHECIAISRTADPVAGGWFLYDFALKDASGNPVFPDYPKIGVWPSGYFMGTQRGFPGGGLDVWAFEREKMLAGKPARIVHFAVSAPSLFLLPSNFDGDAPRPETPNFFARQVDGARFGGANRLEIFAFHVDWKTPTNSTFTLEATLPTASFSSTLCQGSFMETCIPQPGTPVKLEALSVWTMWRLQFRRFGEHETLLVNHTVNGGAGQAGIRWYELRKPHLGTWTIHQQGTYAPDGASRWMGSVAMNRAKTVALGYSVSSSSVFPSIRSAFRIEKDPLGFLGSETNLMVGAGSQTFSIPRWGNYTTMDVDPKDDCTFWYAGEYMPSTSAAGWRTRISSVDDSSCHH